MCRYLQKRFEAIGLETGDPTWFSKGDIKTLVKAASGQFVYVASVFRYISQRRGSPSERLKIVLTWTPDKHQKTRPFEALDRLSESPARTAGRDTTPGAAVATAVLLMTLFPVILSELRR